MSRSAASHSFFVIARPRRSRESMSITRVHQKVPRFSSSGCPLFRPCGPRRPRARPVAPASPGGVAAAAARSRPRARRPSPSTPPACLASPPPPAALRAGCCAHRSAPAPAASAPGRAPRRTACPASPRTPSCTACTGTAARRLAPCRTSGCDRLQPHRRPHTPRSSRSFLLRPAPGSLASCTVRRRTPVWGYFTLHRCSLCINAAEGHDLKTFCNIRAGLVPGFPVLAHHQAWVAVVGIAAVAEDGVDPLGAAVVGEQRQLHVPVVFVDQRAQEAEAQPQVGVAVEERLALHAGAEVARGRGHELRVADRAHRAHRAAVELALRG